MLAVDRLACAMAGRIVEKVRSGLADTIREPWKVEQVGEDFRELCWEDIVTSRAYGDYCTTIRAVKPEGSGAWRGR